MYYVYGRMYISLVCMYISLDDSTCLFCFPLSKNRRKMERISLEVINRSRS